MSTSTTQSMLLPQQGDEKGLLAMNRHRGGPTEEEAVSNACAAARHAKAVGLSNCLSGVL